jgi:hypothetical protein
MITSRSLSKNEVQGRNRKQNTVDRIQESGARRQERGKTSREYEVSSKDIIRQRRSGARTLGLKDSMTPGLFELYKLYKLDEREKLFLTLRPYDPTTQRLKDATTFDQRPTTNDKLPALDLPRATD